MLFGTNGSNKVFLIRSQENESVIELPPVKIEAPTVTIENKRRKFGKKIKWMVIIVSKKKMLVNVTMTYIWIFCHIKCCCLFIWLYYEGIFNILMIRIGLRGYASNNIPGRPSSMYWPRALSSAPMSFEKVEMFFFIMCMDAWGVITTTTPYYGDLPPCFLTSINSSIRSSSSLILLFFSITSSDSFVRLNYILFSKNAIN